MADNENSFGSSTSDAFSAAPDRRNLQIVALDQGLETSTRRIAELEEELESTQAQAQADYRNFVLLRRRDRRNLEEEMLEETKELEETEQRLRQDIEYLTERNGDFDAEIKCLKIAEEERQSNYEELERRTKNEFKTLNNQKNRPPGPN